MYQPPQDLQEQRKFYEALVRLKTLPEFQEFQKNLMMNLSRLTSELREESNEIQLKWMQGASQELDGILGDIANARDRLDEVLK